jgi:hypothetical protein
MLTEFKNGLLHLMHFTLSMLAGLLDGAQIEGVSIE